MAKLFFLLSGENETLPAAELKAIIETEGYSLRSMEKLDQLVRLETEAKCLEAIKRRAAFTRICGLELFNCQADKNTITNAIDSVNFDSFLGENENFAVRIKRVKGYGQGIETVDLEGKIGKHILQNTSKTRVRLKNPDKTFTGILTSDRLIFGVKLEEIQPRPFVERRPRRKPFFHPSAMPAKLARCMVNLARPRAGELVLDPFCGTGSLLIEAALIGCRVLGLDVQRRMARGCLENLKHFSLEPQGLMVADARKIPIMKVDCVATDPPYGRSATTLRLSPEQIVEVVLARLQELLNKGRRICIASPKTLSIAHVGVDLGYKHLESHFAYVHRNLTREIAVFEKV
ncbi:MAG: DNA methyltransferase [Candidatus Bathycorpusculaceae bacterium]